MTKKIALVGNPNSGKTSVFNALTGLNQKVGNYAGVTVERKTGTFKVKNETFIAIDLPGTYSLYPKSEDERIACQILYNLNHEDHPDIVVVVADATNLKRHLLLCTQIIDLGFPTLLALNMIDLLPTQGIELNIVELSARLGIPVIPISALKNQGIETLKEWLSKPLPLPKKSIFSIPEALHPKIEQIQQKYHLPNAYLAFHYLMQPNHIEQIHGADKEKLFSLTNEDRIVVLGRETLARLEWIDEQLRFCLKQDPPKTTLEQKLDKVLTHKIWGYIIFLLILFVIFQAIFAWAEYPMNAIERAFEWINEHLTAWLPESTFTEVLTDGIIAGLAGVVVFIPQIAFLFFFMALLEDTGYMARVVFLLDKIMRKFGLSGKSVVPMLGGMACAVPSIMATRTIENSKERLITILITPLMSCSARIPVYTLIIGLFVPSKVFLGIFNSRGLVMMGMYVLGVLTSLLVAILLKKLVKYDEKGFFLMEMPLYRMPRWKNVVITIWVQVKTFVWDAGKIIVAISIVLWFLANHGGSSFQAVKNQFKCEQIENETLKKQCEQTQKKQLLENSYAGKAGKFLEPLIAPMGLDWKMGIALITSFAAREVFVGTMATIYSLENAEDNLTDLQIAMQKEIDPITQKPQYNFANGTALMLYYAFAMQCMGTLAAIKKETRSWKWTLFSLLYMMGLAYTVATIAYQIMQRYV
ncbi:MAG: ferrous iron transport protein B [Bacteroidia bacterium]|nr:ferrous iron transport protein B [Bacteroidia bacterium]MDW8302422.1 ferrous iron transport protein B [Bacteroidia bacterium]